MSVAALEPQFFDALVTLLGVKETCPGQGDLDRYDEMRAVFTETFGQRTQAEWVAHFEGTDACVAGILPISEAVGHPHLVARRTFVEHEGMVQPQPAPRFSRTGATLGLPPSRHRRPAHPGGPGRVGRRRRRGADRPRRRRPGLTEDADMKPFLFLGIRAQDAAADDEYAAVLRCSGLGEGDVRRVRLEQEVLGPLDLDDWSGIIVGGGPWNVSDPQDQKAAEQVRGEARLRELALQVVAADFPFLGACYGVGTLGTLAGGVVDRTYGEPIGPMEIALTDEGRRDQLLGGLSDPFTALLGHKEAVSRLPDGAVLLASSATCPVQAFRIGANVYATQFHPELDVAGIVTRIEVYRHFGYFEPHEARADHRGVARRARHRAAADPDAVRRALRPRIGRRPVCESGASATGWTWDSTTRQRTRALTSRAAPRRQPAPSRVTTS